MDLAGHGIGSRPGFQDFFGVSVAVSGDTIVVGAQTAQYDGRAYVFVRSGTSWTQQGLLIPSNPGNFGEWFGKSVSVSGDTVVVGAPFEASNTTGVNPPSNNAAFDAGYAAALGKSVITLHDGALTHALKEVDAAALAIAETPEQVVQVLAYAIRGDMPGR